MKQTTQTIERRLGDAMRTRLPRPIAELVMFTFKQAWACLFGALMLAGLIASDLIWQETWTIARYDALVIYGHSPEQWPTLKKAPDWFT